MENYTVTHVNLRRLSVVVKANVGTRLHMLGVSRADIARAMGVTRARISHAMAGRCTLERIQWLATLLVMPVAVLTAGDKEQVLAVPTPSKREWLDVVVTVLGEVGGTPDRPINQNPDFDELWTRINGKPKKATKKSGKGKSKKKKM